MSFDISVSRRLGDTTIATSFVTSDGITVLLGASGVGKTSILNMVAGLLRPDSGHIRIAGRTLFASAEGIDLPAHRRRIGYIFQDGRLFPHKRVRANLLYGSALVPEAEHWISLDEVTRFLGISDLLDRWPRSLSGGEAQRVAIGRALLAGPRLLLMDEPISSLDTARREEVMQVIERIRDELRLPILYVTHDPAEAERLATHRVELRRG